MLGIFVAHVEGNIWSLICQVHDKMRKCAIESKWLLFQATGISRPKPNNANTNMCIIYPNTCLQSISSTDYSVLNCMHTSIRKLYTIFFLQLLDDLAQRTAVTGALRAPSLSCSLAHKLCVLRSIARPTFKHRNDNESTSVRGAEQSH